MEPGTSRIHLVYALFPAGRTAGAGELKTRPPRARRTVGFPGIAPVIPSMSFASVSSWKRIAKRSQPAVSARRSKTLRPITVDGDSELPWLARGVDAILPRITIDHHPRRR